MKWNNFCFLGGSDCFIAATIASIISWDDVKGGCGSGLISQGIGGKRESLVFNWDSDDRVFVVNWDHDGFVVNVNGVLGFPWSPGGPVVLNIKVSTLDEGSEEVEIIVVSVYVNENNPVIGAKGEDGRGSEACAGEFMIDCRHDGWG